MRGFIKAQARVRRMVLDMCQLRTTGCLRKNSDICHYKILWD